MKKLTIDDLQKIIKEEASKMIAKKTNESPSSFREFSNRIADSLKEANAPKALVQEISKCEHGGATSALLNAWRTIETQMKGQYASGVNPKDIVKEGFWNYFTYEVHDAIVDAVTEHQNPLNYAVGRKVSKVDPQELAENAVKFLTTEAPMARISGEHPQSATTVYSTRNSQIDRISVLAAHKRLCDELGTWPTVDDLAQELNVPAEAVIKIIPGTGLSRNYETDEVLSDV